MNQIKSLFLIVAKIFINNYQTKAAIIEYFSNKIDQN